MSAPTATCGPVGGPGGTAFTDSSIFERTGARITALTLNTGDYIDALIVTYSDGTVIKHGGVGGISHHYPLSHDEHIEGLDLHADQYVTTLIFYLNSGRVIAAGNIALECNVSFRKNNAALVYFFGRAHRFVDQLGAVFAVPNRTHSEHVALADLESQAHAAVPQHGYQDISTSDRSLLVAKSGNITVDVSNAPRPSASPFSSTVKSLSKDFVSSSTDKTTDDVPSSNSSVSTEDDVNVDVAPPDIGDDDVPSSTVEQAEAAMPSEYSRVADEKESVTATIPNVSVDLSGCDAPAESANYPEQSPAIPITQPDVQTTVVRPARAEDDEHKASMKSSRPGELEGIIPSNAAVESERPDEVRTFVGQSRHDPNAECSGRVMGHGHSWLLRGIERFVTSVVYNVARR